MRWHLSRFDVVHTWMLAASHEERVAMRAFVRALVSGPLELAHHHMRHPSSEELLSFAQPPGLNHVLAWLADSETKTITFVGVTPCVDGLVFNAARRVTTDDV